MCLHKIEKKPFIGQMNFKISKPLQIIQGRVEPNAKPCAIWKPCKSHGIPSTKTNFRNIT